MMLRLLRDDDVLRTNDVAPRSGANDVSGFAGREKLHEKKRMSHRAQQLLRSVRRFNFQFTSISI